jgi:hypothetical protein
VIDNALAGLLKENKMSKQYLSCAETAKLVRSALKESFPGVKFSVTSKTYSGGASISIYYVDGPTYEQVKAVTGVFEGSYFDGMQDYKGSNYGSLDNQEVRFGADYVFVNRSFSVEFLTVMARTVCKKYGVEVVYEIKNSQYSGAYIDGANEIVMPCSRYFAAAVNYAASEISMCDSQVSKTLSRVGFLGDDGYGYGAVGRLAA